jgi:hypothetical protein
MMAAPSALVEAASLVPTSCQREFAAFCGLFAAPNRGLATKEAGFAAAEVESTVRKEMGAAKTSDQALASPFHKPTMLPSGSASQAKAPWPGMVTGGTRVLPPRVPALSR